MLQWRICLNFFLNLSYFINFIIRSLLFVSDCCLPWLHMLFAVHLVRSWWIRNIKGNFFSCLLGYMCSFPCTLCDHDKSETMRKLEKKEFYGKLTKIQPHCVENLFLFFFFFVICRKKKETTENKRGEKKNLSSFHSFTYLFNLAHLFQSCFLP